MNPNIEEEVQEATEGLPHTQITIDIVGNHLHIAELLVELILRLLVLCKIPTKDVVTSALLTPQKGDIK